MRRKAQQSNFRTLFANLKPNDLVDYIKEFDYQYSDKTDAGLILPFFVLFDSRDVSSHKFDVGKTRLKFHVTLWRQAQGRVKRATTQ